MPQRTRPPRAAPSSSDDAGSIARARLEDAPVGVFETDLDGRCTFVNARWCEYAGLSADESLDGGWLAAIHPDDRERLDVAWRAAISSDEELRLEFRLRRPDGLVRWVAGRGVAVRGAGGTITRLLGSVTDVTEEVDARERLLNERRYVETVLDTAGSLVCVLDRDGRILRFNRACEVLTGYSFEEIRGLPFYDFLLPKDEIEAVKIALDQIRPGEPPAASENSWITRSGASRLISWLDTCFFDDAGTLTHIVSTGLDITDERRAELAIKGIESVATLLATTGPTAPTLTALLDVVGKRTGFASLALFVPEDGRLSLGAARGYGSQGAPAQPDEALASEVLRVAKPRLVVSERRSQIAVPLIAKDLPLGVLLIESDSAAPATDVELRLAIDIGERLTVALVLGRDQQMLAERARLFGALSAFGRTTNSILDEEPMVLALVGAAADVVPADVVALVALDRETGRYLIRAVGGTHIDGAAVGGEIKFGEGVTGRAIASRVPVLDRLVRARYPEAIRNRIADDSLATVAVPLVREGIVLGALIVGRASDVDPGFSDLELEVLALLGTQAALALANTHLVAETRALAIRDHLTGLYNRRHFDASLDHILARWLRDREIRQPVAAIMFDLDHFGQLNNEHGHEAGDAVLRAFAGILQTRFRSADLVARYGGEEFVAVLEGATRDQAAIVAEEVRCDLAERIIRGPDGIELRASVSAGCSEIDSIDPTRETLLRAADIGLFMAKRSGRNRVVAV